MFDLATVAAGIIAGITYALTAYGKKQGQPFNASKFGATILVGAGAGIAMAYMNLPVDVAYLYVMNLGIVPVAENLLKTVYRKVYLKFLKIIDNSN